MRALLAGSACLLTAATAAAQPQPPVNWKPAPTATSAPVPATSVPVTHLAPDVPPDPALSARVGEACADSGSGWGMSGPRVWGEAEYLLWWVTPMNTPDLIQAVPSAIALNAVNTGAQLPAGSARRVFPPDRQLDFGPQSGVRGTIGANFDRFGVEVSAFGLERATERAELFNNGVPVTPAISYVQAATGTPISLFAAIAGQYTGGVRASLDTRLWGAEANVRVPWYTFLTTNNDALVGFRYLDLEENLFSQFQANFPDGSSTVVMDTVRTRNEFYGGQVGLNGRLGGSCPGLGLDVLGKMALGNVHQRAELFGSNTFLVPGTPPDTEPAGLYARGANQGVFTRDEFAAVFELNSNLTYNFTSWSQVYIGYSIVWISSVQRPGEVIDEVVNDARVRFVADPAPGNLNRPAFRWNANDFWAQGITFGVRLQY